VIYLKSTYYLSNVYIACQQVVWTAGRHDLTSPHLRKVAVRRTNDHGIQNVDGTWCNASKFARLADVVLPVAAAAVRLHLDRSGYVRKIEPLVVAPVAKPSPLPVASTQPAGVSVSNCSDHNDQTTKVSQDDRGVSDARAIVLATATTIRASGGRIADPAEVMFLAAKLEGWVARA
jgi:hypothetical protein